MLEVSAVSTKYVLRNNVTNSTCQVLSLFFFWQTSYTNTPAKYDICNLFKYFFEMSDTLNTFFIAKKI